MKRYRLWLCLPALLTGAIDGSLTLIGQGKFYWNGNYAAVNEFSPMFRWLLQQHPSAFIGGFLLYLVLVSTLLVYIPNKLAKILSLTMVLAHTWGTTTWLPNIGISYYWYTLVFALFATITLFSFEKAELLRVEQKNSSDGVTPPQT